MNYDISKNLGKTIQVKAANRPIKIAYLIPHEESKSNHWIIDAVFYESYTRWAGALTLLIPTNNNSFLSNEYERWLELYDPDFVYTYVDLEKEFVKKLDYLCCPIALLSFKDNSHGAEKTRWQDYLPEWGIYLNSISSLSTLHSPYADYKQSIGSNKIVLTQYGIDNEERFLTDNYGTNFDLLNVTNPRKGLFETCCLAPKDLPANHSVGTTRITSFAEVISHIANNKVIPISRLALIHSNSVPRVMPRSWGRNFDLFVGDRCLDRIHFWNGRHFSSDIYGIAGTLLVKKDLFNDTEFVKPLGQYFNKHNYRGQEWGSPRVALRSYSLTTEELSHIKDVLEKFTFNQVLVTNPHNIPAIPTGEDFEKYYSDRSDDMNTFKVNETNNTIQPDEPEHFKYTPPRYRGINRGQWAIELAIERHNDLSRFSNVIDIWKLPRRKKVTRAFTRNLSKVSYNHLLTLLPTNDSFPFRSDSVKNDYYYDLSLPIDSTIFRFLILDLPKLPSDDLRASLNYESYKEMSISDKGQNLRGVISMFNNRVNESACLTNKYWRQVIRSSQVIKKKEENNNYDKPESKNRDNYFTNLFNKLWHKITKKSQVVIKEKENRNKVVLLNTEHVFAFGKLRSYLPNDKLIKEQIQQKVNFKNLKDIKKHYKSSLTDALEDMISKNVFYQVHQWRCLYCGHANIRTFDQMKKKNECEICVKSYFAPINIAWKYKLNNFIFNSLVSRNGLTVLWALNNFQDRGIQNSFYYLPEVDLFLDRDSSESKNEIDILCVVEGKFYATEVEKSASSFIGKSDEIKKFIKKINLIRPDVALLVFEQYCKEGENTDPIKKELKKVVADIYKNVSNYIKVEIVVASDYPEFNEYPLDIGYY